MPSRSITDLHPDLAYAYGLAVGRWMHLYPNAPKPFLTATNRPDAEQDQLYAQGRSLPGPIVTDAKAGQSPHNYLPALAFDVAFKYPNGEVDWDARLFSQFARLMPDNVAWGGYFKSIKDLPHFELIDWKKKAGLIPSPPPPPPPRIIKEGQTPPAPPKR